MVLATSAAVVLLARVLLFVSTGANVFFSSKQFDKQ